MNYSAHSESPAKFHFWTAVSVLAGALRRHVWIDMGYFQWVPNFYIIFVAPPGIVSKSTTAEIGMSLLRDVEGVHFGPDAITWQALTQSLAQSSESFHVPGEKEDFSMSAITIVGSELGTLLNPQDREMIDAFVSLWDGRLGEWKKATKTQGTDVIINPWLNLLGCTTPAWICGNFPEYMIGGGFTSRTVFVYAEQKRQLIAYPKDYLPKNFDMMRKELTDDLVEIGKITGEYILSRDARAWGEIWYKDHYEKPNKNLDDGMFGGYKARKQTHLHKLAMVLAASESNRLLIEVEHLKMAEAMVTALEEDMPKIFSQIGRSDSSKQSQALVSTVYAQGRISMQDLYRHMYRIMSVEDFERAMAAAIKARLIIREQEGSTVYVKPTEKSVPVVKEEGN